eukprot:CCRYP_008036-RA/>CCRYP_008036-RA protein AED:0.30 eAED:0.29 QI:0/-1/0/1/-1/1/1/0/582
MTENEYSVKYSSAAGGAIGNIMLPGRESELSSNPKAVDSKDQGVIITPEPSIVIKTRLLKASNNTNFSDDSAASILNIACDGSIENSLNNFQTKVFINICTHPLICLPTKRKTIDEETKNEVDGWHLPMSMGELRPCFDKSGNAAIVADCIMNPSVVQDMNDDPNHFHFVCDLVIQCATKKFSKTCFGGLEIDKRYKVPKMKYAGYVDEVTGLPTDFKTNQPNASSRSVVAKQRVKGNGGRRPILEELNSTPTPTRSGNLFNTSECRPQSSRSLHLIPIELFVEDSSKECIPLSEFLIDVAKGLSPGALAKRIMSPDLKAIVTDGSSGNLHASQLLLVPIPYVYHPSQTTSSALSSASGIVAKCIDATADIIVNLSAFQLVLSSPYHSKTECVLPFPVDSHRTSCTFNAATKTLKISMPLLHIEGPDPGTKQWEIANALSRDVNGTCDSGLGKIVSNEDCDFNAAEQSSHLNTENDTESFDENQQLPEDAFHCQDALSRLYLEQQEEERQAKKISSNFDDKDVEFIDVKDFCPREASFSQEMNDTDLNDNPVLRQAELKLKECLTSGDIGTLIENKSWLRLV